MDYFTADSRLYERVPNCHEELELRKAIKASRKDFDLYAGLPCLKAVAGSEGVVFSLLVPDGMSRSLLVKALNEAYSSLDVISHEVVVCPLAWFA